MSKAIRETKKFYDKYGRKFWTNRKTNSFYYEKQFTKISELWPEGGRVLDIGCAAGIHVPMFLGIGRHVKYEGIDTSKQFLRDAARRYPQLPFHEGSITDEKLLAKNRFSGFWANSVLMHIPYEDWDNMFSNIENISKPGSYGYISLPIKHPSGKPSEIDNRHFTILSEKEQRDYFKSRNWKIISKGKADGFSTEDVWRWYIVQLPQPI